MTESIHQIITKMEDQAPKNDPKIIAVVSYLTLIGWLIAYVLNKPRDTFASFHMRQSLGINLIFVASGIIAIIPFLGWLVSMAGYLVGLVFWLIGILSAVQGEEKLIPTELGPRFQEWFQGI